MIYFLQGDNDYIKIGYTIDVSRRVQFLQTGSPTRLKLLGVMEGRVDTEAALHRRFERSRIIGEWFKPSQAILDYIAQNTAMPVAEKSNRYGHTKLGAWLADNDLTAVALAAQLGVSAASITRILQDKQIPRKDLMEKLYSVTQGAVQPNDFYSLSFAEQESSLSKEVGR